jgi:hypothetical protein
MKSVIKYAKYATVFLSLAVVGVKFWSAVLELQPLLA